MKFIDKNISEFTLYLDTQKDKNPLVICVDPGLKGAIVVYSMKHGDLSMMELPVQHSKKLLSGEILVKTLINLRELHNFIDSKIKVFGSQIVYLIIEKPFKRSLGSLKTYSTSVIEVGKILALIELITPVNSSFVCLPTPSSWTHHFSARVCKEGFAEHHGFSDGRGYGMDLDIKKKRAKALIDLFEFDEKSFYTERGRLKDGLSDACAMLMWILHLGKTEFFTEI